MSAALPNDLRTSRLLLREPRPKDASIIFQTYAQDERVSRYLIWHPNTRLAETETFIEGCIQGRLNGDRYAYVLALPSAEDIPIGMLDAKIDLHGVEIGYVLSPSHWGKAYVSEAVAAFAAAVLEMPAHFRVQAYCDVDNPASARTLEKAGFQREGRLERFIVHPNISKEPRACYLYARCK
jgi:RimJ/RimL family protein N-acetyltransferase